MVLLAKKQVRKKPLRSTAKKVLDPRLKLILTVLFCSIIAGLLYSGGYIPGSKIIDTFNNGSIKRLDKPSHEIPDKTEDLQSLIKSGNSEYDRGRYEEAVQYYEKALKIDGDRVDVLTDLATCYYFIGYISRSLEMFDKALTVDPDYPNALYNKGVVLKEGRGNLKAAAEVWRRYLQVAPDGYYAVNVKNYMDNL